jgi:hypothetical protein
VAVLTSSWLLNSVFARDLSRRSASRVGGEPFLQRSSQRIDRRLILRFLSAFRDDPNAPSELYQLDLIGGRFRPGLVLIHSLPAIRHKESLWSYVHAILHILIGSVSRIPPWFAMSRSRCSLDFVRRPANISSAVTGAWPSKSLYFESLAPSPAQAWALVGPALTCRSWSRRANRMCDVTADVVHRAPGDGLGSMGTAAVFQLSQATVHKPA